MKSRGVIGKRIVKIHQERFCDGPFRDGSRVNVLYIELEDGTHLVPITVETDSGSEYAHDFVVRRPSRTK